MKAKFYRHRSISSTRDSLKSFHKHLSKVGELLYVRGAFIRQKHGAWYSVVIRGTSGKLVLRGCSWGYSGEGCRGTETVLRELGVHSLDVQRCAFEAPNNDANNAHNQTRPVKVIWQLTLPALLPQLHNGDFISKTTHAQALHEVELYNKVQNQSSQAA